MTSCREYNQKNIAEFKNDKWENKQQISPCSIKKQNKNKQNKSKFKK